MSHHLPAMHANRVRLELLGPPRFILAGGHCVALQRVDALLLGWLAWHGPATREQLANWIWVDKRDARANLRQRIAVLSKRAGVQVVVAKDRTLVRLGDELEIPWLDADRRVRADPHACDGEWLAGTPTVPEGDASEWLRSTRRQWKDRQTSLLRARVQALSEEGDPAGALAYAERLIAEQPGLEEGHQLLMGLHLRLGNRSAALSAYEQCCRDMLRLCDANPAAETDRLYASALRPDAGATRQDAAIHQALAHPPQLVGRDGERAQLRQLWQECRSVFLCGDAGLGKTRLARDFVSEADRVVVVAAVVGDGAVPYIVLGRLVRAALQWCPALPDEVRAELARLLPELGSAPPAPLEPARLALAIGQLLSCGPKAVLLDDVHHADQATLELLPSLADAPTGPRWLLTLSAAECPPSLASWREQKRSRIGEVQLSPLNPLAIEALLASLDLPGVAGPAWASALHRHCGGNVVFLLHVIREALPHASAADGVPDLPFPASVGSLIERRLQRLSASALSVARIAALAGANFSAQLACDVMEVQPLALVEPWAELERTGFFSVTGWSHDLMAEAARRGIPAPLTELLHAQIARRLATREAPAAQIAWRWEQANHPVEAGAALFAAATSARLLARRDEEVAALKRALQCHAQADGTDRHFDTLEALSYALLLAQGALAAGPYADLLVESAADERRRMRAAIVQSEVANHRGDGVASQKWATEALAVACRTGDEKAEWHALRNLAQGLALSGRPDDGVSILAAAGPRVEATNDLLVEYEHVSALGYCLNQTQRTDECIAALHRARTLARSVATTDEWLTATTNLAVAHYEDGQATRALELAEEADRVLPQLGEVHGQPQVNRLNLAVFLAATGRFGAAIKHIEAARLSFNEASAVWRHVAESFAMTLWARLGRIDLARRIATPIPDAMPAFVRAQRHLAEARVNQPAVAKAAIERGLRLLPIESKTSARLRLAIDPARGLEPDAGSAACAAAAEEAAVLNLPVVVAEARMREAEHRFLAGQLDAAARCIGQARFAASKLTHFQLYPPEVAWTACRIHAALGDDAAARLALEEAARWMRETALPALPALYHAAFLERNLINRAVSTACRNSGVRA